MELFVRHMNEPNNLITPHHTSPPTTLPQPNTSPTHSSTPIPPQPDTPPSHSSTPIPTLDQTKSHAQTIDSHTLIPINNSSQTMSTHPMVTRAKAGIFKPLECMNCHVTTTLPLPRSLVHALRDPYWKEAMLDEYNALISNETWVLVPRPANVNVVRSMWLFKHKFKVSGSLNRYKACLVANGHSQQQGIDCNETFSLVVKSATICTVLSLAVSRDWPIHQLDVKNVFLHAFLQQNIASLYIEFAMTDLGSLNYFLESKLGSDGDPVSDPTLYRNLAGALQYLTFTHPDLSYDVQHLHVSSTTQLSAYIDADWAGCPVTRQSTSGYCVLLSDNLLSWSAKCQVTLAHSSAEAEYQGVANVVAETAWICNLLCELHTPLFTTTLVYCDNLHRVWQPLVRCGNVNLDEEYGKNNVKAAYNMADRLFNTQSLPDFHRSVQVV
nr:hypothetical protein [Tanacetum cinerariifolium]